MALTTDKATPRYGADAVADDFTLPLAASATIYRGALVALNMSGYAVNAVSTHGNRVVGVAQERVVNSGSAGAKSIRVERGAFGFANSAGDDAITLADVGRPCWVVDNETVARTSANGARVFAGHVVRVDGSTIYVEVGVRGEDAVARDILVEAAADLSSSQYLFVEMNTDGDVTVCNGAGEDAVGVLQNSPASGAIAIVRVFGESRVIASASVNAGALVATTNAGKSKTAVAATTNTSDGGAASDPLVGSFVMGRALTTGSTDAQHSVFVHPMGAVPSTAA